MAPPACSPLASTRGLRARAGLVPNAPAHPVLVSARAACPPGSASPARGRARVATARRSRCVRARAAYSPARSKTEAPADDGRDVDGACFMLAEQQLRMWLGLSGSADLRLKQEVLPVRHTTTHLYASALRVTAGDRAHAVVCLVVPLSPAGESSPLYDGVLVHWGTQRRPGERWRPPASGWHTYPEISRDGGGGAWQTLMAQHEVAGEDMLVMMLQLPLEGVVSEGGLSLILKTGQQQWLGNASTRKDFFLQLSELPEARLGAGWEPEAAPTDALTDDLARSRIAALLQAQGPEAPLDLARLSRQHGTGERRRSSSRQQREEEQRQQQQQQQHNHHDDRQAHAEHHHHHEEHHHHHHHHEQQQQQQQQHNHDAPSDFGGLAGRRASPVGPDASQVCSLTAAQLHRGAEHQLKCFMDAQEDLVLPSGRMRVQQAAFSLHGCPGTPFVVASAVTRSRDGAPVLCLAALADGGVTGSRTPGLVLAYGAAAGGAGGQHVEQLPWGWKSHPELTWDGGNGWWEMPFTQALLQPGALALEGHRGTYMACLRLNLEGALTTKGLSLRLRNAHRQWMDDAVANGPMYVSTAEASQHVNLHTPPPAAHIHHDPPRFGLPPAQQQQRGAAGRDASRHYQPRRAAPEPARR